MDIYDQNKVQNFKFEEDIKNIRLNLENTGVLYEDPHFYYYLGPDKEWKRPKDICERPFFIKDGKYSKSDALQRELHDCWLVCSIQAITSNEELMKHVVPQNQGFDMSYIGAFHFRIWQFGTWYDVVVDDRLPVFKRSNRPSYAYSRSQDVFWGALLEKAYAKVRGRPPFTYDSINAGDDPLMSLRHLSGGLVERFDLKKPPPNVSVELLLQEAYSNKAFITLHSLTSEKGLVKNHAYSVTKVHKFDNEKPDPRYRGLYLVRIMNPHGWSEWKGDWSDDDVKSWEKIDREIREMLNFTPSFDGEFWMQIDDMIKYFYMINVCHLGPYQYLVSLHKYPDPKIWQTRNLWGEWVKGFSAGGSDVPTRHMNPQFTMLIECPDMTQPCIVVIEVIRKSKTSRDMKTITEMTAFYIYSMDNFPNISMPLDKNFFEHNDPMDKRPDFTRSVGGSFIKALTLKPGTYCIVPCTWQRAGEGQFLLRIFSESRTLTVVSFDGKLSKSLPMEDPERNKLDYELKKLFNEAVQDQEEVDWVGLKVVLDKALRPTRSYNGIFATLLDFFRNIFQIPSKSIFTKNECRSMIAMLDDDHSGKLSFLEFSNLWNKICFWTKVFEQHKAESEGYLAVSQLKDALGAIGYNVNKRIVHSLGYIYADDQSNFFLTDFILCGVTLETLIALCDKKDIDNEDGIKFTSEEWVRNTLVL